MIVIDFAMDWLSDGLIQSADKGDLYELEAVWTRYFALVDGTGETFPSS